MRMSVSFLLPVVALTLAACGEPAPAPVETQVFKSWTPTGAPGLAGFTAATCEAQPAAAPPRVGARFTYEVLSLAGDLGGVREETIVRTLADGAETRAAFDPVREDGPAHALPLMSHRWGVLPGATPGLDITYPDDAGERIRALTPGQTAALAVRRRAAAGTADGQAIVTLKGCGRLKIGDGETAVRVYDVTPFEPSDRSKPVRIDRSRIYVLDDAGWPAAVENRFGVRRLVRRS